MNKLLLIVAGIAIITLSDAPSAHADASTWNPTDQAPSASADFRFPVMPPVSSADLNQASQPSQAQPMLPAEPSIAEGTNAPRAPVMPLAPAQPFPEPLPLPFSPAQSSHTQPSQTQASNPQPFAVPIPSDLGVQFDLSEQLGQSAGSKTPASEIPASETPALAPALPSASASSPSLPRLNSPQLVFPQPLDVPDSVSSAPLSPPASPASKSAEFTLRDLFAQDSDSLVAAAVGSAEGTRSPDGKPNQHFYGHPDPGNGVWNLGTFSYQHGAASPEEADVKQLNRLKQQAQVMQEKIAAQGLSLTLEEALNGIDLANQAPKAVIDAEGGYIEWLAKAHHMGKSGSEAILWARVQSFIDPQTQQWNAPGLGNTADSITHDQNRRMQAIASAMAAQNDSIAPDARLRLQPIGFIPRWNFARQVFHNVSGLFRRT